MTRNADQTARRARHRRFHLLVQRVVNSLPENVQCLLDDVAIVIQDEPSADQRLESDIDDGDDLFGPYQGIPRTERSSGHTLVMPGRITIFAGPLERTCSNRRELEEETRITVLHGLGHHLGYGEAGLDKLGLS